MAEAFFPEGIARMACALLQPVPEIPALQTSGFVPYVSYSGALAVSGAVVPVVTTDVTQSSLERARRGRREARAMLHAPNRWPEAAIAPVRLLPCPPSADAPSSCEGVDRWWVFVHTAALHPAMAALRAAAADLRADPALDLALEVSATPLPLLRFQLRGARSHALRPTTYCTRARCGAGGRGPIAPPPDAVQGLFGDRSSVFGHRARSVCNRRCAIARFGLP